MFQFIRTSTPKHAASIPAALAFAAEATGYLNKTYGINMKYGMRVLGPPTLFWEFESDSLDKIAAMNAKLVRDREFTTMLERAKELFVDGSIDDMIIAFT